jgi:hypothetical protein
LNGSLDLGTREGPVKDAYTSPISNLCWRLPRWQRATALLHKRARQHVDPAQEALRHLLREILPCWAACTLSVSLQRGFERDEMGRTGMRRENNPP